MSDKKDIIGIVKGLKEPPEYDVELHMIWKEEVAENFPTIAKALEIAVEALEEIEQMYCHDVEDGMPSACNREAKEALSRIQQL